MSKWLFLFMIVAFGCAKRVKVSEGRSDPFTPSSEVAGVKVSCRYLGTEGVGVTKKGIDSVTVYHHSFLFSLSVDDKVRMKDQTPEYIDFGVQKDFFFITAYGDVSPVMVQRESRTELGLTYLVVFEVADSLRLPLRLGYNDKAFGSGPRYFQFDEFINRE